MHNVYQYELLTTEMNDATSSTTPIRLGIIAGVHGNEMGTISMANMLNESFKNKTRKGFPGNNISQLTILPCANYAGMTQNCRDVPIPNTNMNDLNRGWIDENPNNNAAVRENIKNVIDNSDIIIDMHCSPIIRSTFLLDSDQNHLFDILKWCDSCNINCCVRDCTNVTIKKYVSNYCENKICLTWEQNGMTGSNESQTTLAEYLEKFIDEIIANIYKLSDIIKYNRGYNAYKNRAGFIDKYRLTPIYARRSGMWIPNIKGCDINNDNCTIRRDIGAIVSDNESYDIFVEAYDIVQILTSMRYVKEFDILGYISKDRASE